ncbi:MAG: hypothetical protein HDT42_09020 [Ruminococcaceae bacterium]|nr:hypothetical protein [Oscillospiraceae bacterium]
MAECIERKKVYADISRLLVVDDIEPKYQDAWETAIIEAMSIVEKAPAADIRPERHGRWLYCGDGYECSECGGDSRVSSHPFCWRCGAKMDGKDGDTGEE